MAVPAPGWMQRRAAIFWFREGGSPAECVKSVFRIRQWHSTWKWRGGVVLLGRRAWKQVPLRAQDGGEIVVGLLRPSYPSGKCSEQPGCGDPLGRGCDVGGVVPTRRRRACGALDSTRDGAPPRGEGAEGSISRIHAASREERKSEVPGVPAMREMAGLLRRLQSDVPEFFTFTVFRIQ